MNRILLCRCLAISLIGCGYAAGGQTNLTKKITVDKSTFSDIYPAVWFSPSTGEISALKERSEIPPEGKFEIWIEPKDPEFGFISKQMPKDVGFVLVGKGREVFENPPIPASPRLDTELKHLMTKDQSRDGLVFLCKATTCSCLLMITEIDTKTQIVTFEWRPLPAQERL